MTHQITKGKIMKRYYITVKDNFGNSRQMLVTKKELSAIEKHNPQLTVKIDYELVGKFSYEK